MDDSSKYNGRWRATGSGCRDGVVVAARIRNQRTVVVAARICEERTDGGGQAHHSSDVRPAEEHPVVGRPDGDVGAVGEPVDDDRDHGEAEAEDKDEQVLRVRGSASGGEVALARRRGAHGWRSRACSSVTIFRSRNVSENIESAYPIADAMP